MSIDSASGFDAASAPDAATAVRCGGFAGTPCPMGQLCLFGDDEFNACQAADERGTCIDPTSCGKVFSPQCGCDMKQYDNLCSLASSGVTLFNHGTCACTEHCGATSYCALCDIPRCLPIGTVCET